MNLRLIPLFVLAVPGAVFAADVKPSVAPAAPVAAAPRADSSVAPAASFEAFRVIGDRNIFNPYRTGRRERSEEPAPRVDTISLVGTMDCDQGVFAFFDGSDAAFRKVLRVGETVGQFKVAQISSGGVELEHDGKGISLRLAQQLRRAEGADWTLVGADVAQAEAQARNADAARADPTAPPVISASDDDVVKRMKERRQKDLTK